MDYDKAQAIITKHGGTMEHVINWTWAQFDTDEQGRTCFEEMKAAFPDMEHRGYYAAAPNSDNENLHRGGFRFR